jgi:hypothetical protein
MALALRPFFRRALFSTLVRAMRPVALMVVAVGIAGAAQAQAVAPGIDAGRDCQTIRRCNFTKTGTFRGCISAYSCRTCKIDRANCTFDAGAGRKVCNTLSCSWGS